MPRAYASSMAKRVVSVAAALVLVLVFGGLWLRASSQEPVETFCYADGLIGPGGVTYGRSNDLRCQWVTASGELVTTVNTGQPLCYSATDIVACSEPGARSPGTGGLPSP